MDQLFVGVAQVSLYFRHARSLKDKRQVMKSLVQRLKNEGFSVTECARAEDPKRGSLGFCFAGSTHPFVEKMLDQAMRFFVGDFEVLRTQRDIFDYSDEEFERLVWEEDAV